MIRLVASDVDGTLLMAGQDAIPGRVLDAVAQLWEKNIWFAAASGRPCYDLERLFAPVKDQMALIGLDGALTVYRGRVLDESPLDPAAVRQWAGDCLAKGCGGLVFHGKDASYRMGTVHGAARYRQAVRLADIPEPIYKLSLCWPAEDTVPDPRFFSVCYRENDWLEVVAPGVDKGKAMRALQRRLAVTRAETLALGDNDNDLALLREAETAVAMASGKPAVREYCGYVTADAALLLCRLADAATEMF